MSKSIQGGDMSCSFKSIFFDILKTFQTNSTKKKKKILYTKNMIVGYNNTPTYTFNHIQRVINKKNGFR